MFNQAFHNSAVMAPDCLFFEGVRHRPRTARVPGPRASVHTAGMEAVEVDPFVAGLFAQAGLDAEAYRGKALNRRVPACLRMLRARDVEQARQKLLAEPGLLPAAVSVLLLGVTEFFRDPSVFEHVRGTIVPELGALGRPPRVWSAACSDGRELYSVALLLHEADLLRGAQLLGTDCRPEALEQARSGEYPREALERLPTGLSAHLEATTRGPRITSSLRAHAQWHQGDLLRGCEPGPWDLILWRNMAIYLEPQAALRIWTSLFNELAPGGFLVSGKADHPPRHPMMERIGTCILRKRGRAI